MSESTQSPSAFSFVEMEQQILKKWEQEDVFQETLQLNEQNQPYVFFDGPPFATGLPHHGNLLASVIKDIVPRYWTMKGRYVERRFGWDCHGLPIEHEINKKLGMPAHEAVDQLGIAGYNNECRNIVERYVRQWRQVITRIGRWVDFENDYKTMDLDFMESVWWVVKSLWDKGLVYQGDKVMPVSTALATPLSNFEAGLNYQEVQDPSVTVLFKLKNEDAYVSAWTTTPWTLPSNLALCVAPGVDYVRVKEKSTARVFYIAQARVEHYQKSHPLTVEGHVKGSDLVGRSYEPLFSYFADLANEGAFRIVSDDYVQTDEGTGIVHQAPAFGEDDFRIAKEKSIPLSVCPVTMSGNFTQEVTDFSGLFVKDADAKIITYLKQTGTLFDHSTLQHSYPFCYRSQSPLIYRSVPSWFVRVTESREKLLNSNSHIRWVPDHIQEGRMGKWLENVNDWCISRNRVWGTPIPIWQNEVTGKTICIGSLAELKQYTGQELTDLHREFVDEITFEVEGECGTYHRVPEVLDCWFESGSMPYAQSHYPFVNKDKFDQSFPADFIAEGLDQTRGWFYTLIALSTLLFEKEPFKNVIVNGLVLAADGKKMSKSLSNYTDPEILMNTHGADALRLYLINSGLVRGEEQRFSDDGVREMTRRALLPWHNAFLFLELYAKIDGWTPDKLDFEHANVFDRWILSRLQTLKSTVAYEMERYRLDNVVPQLFNFIEELTNWYIRLNRARFWGEGLSQEKVAAYSALYLVVYELTLAMAPCAPFLAEHIYCSLNNLGSSRDQPSSVHLCPYPEPDTSIQDVALENAISRVQRIILLGRKQREDRRVSLRVPLQSLTVIHQDEQLLADIQQLESFVKRELNVKSISYDQDERKYIEWFAKPNFPLLGKRLGKRMRSFQQKIQQLDSDQLQTLNDTGSLTLDDETFTSEEVKLFRQPRENATVATDRLVTIALDFNLTQDLLDEGLAREIVHRIQMTRKEIGFEVTDRIEVNYNATPRLVSVMKTFSDYISSEVLAVKLRESDDSQFSFEIDREILNYSITRV